MPPLQVMNDSHVDSVLMLAVPFYQDADFDFEPSLVKFIHECNLCNRLMNLTLILCCCWLYLFMNTTSAGDE
jgi:hypothetical protein